MSKPRFTVRTIVDRDCELSDLLQDHGRYLSGSFSDSDCANGASNTYVGDLNTGDEYHLCDYHLRDLMLGYGIVDEGNS